jgi:hypothetical protein
MALLFTVIFMSKTLAIDPQFLHYILSKTEVSCSVHVFFCFFRNNLQKSEKEILCARGRELFQLLEKCLWCTLTQKQHICLRSELENKVKLEIFFVKAEMVLEFMV